jgi:hypothetical protein
MDIRCGDHQPRGKGKGNPYVVKLLAKASQSQQAEVCFLSIPLSLPNLTSTQVSDGTKTVLILAGELLKNAEHLLIMGLHPREIGKGYTQACV